MRCGLTIVALLLVVGPGQAAAADPLDPLYARIAEDLKAGKPLVATVHVALCDSNIIWCGRGGFGNGDVPGRNLYWGGAAGLKAYFDHARRRGWRRIFLDQGDGKVVLERVVYRKKVRRPPARLRKLGVTKGFEVLLVGLAYRGSQIAKATEVFVGQVAAEQGGTLRLTDGRTIATGGKGHLVGYAGHDHLMDVARYSWPRRRRERALGYFALACMTGPYMAKQMCSEHARALLLTLSLMYPGAFTIDGIVSAVAAGKPQHQVYLGGVKMYAKYQKRPERYIRRAFLHDAQKRFYRRYKRCPRPGAAAGAVLK